MGAMTTEDFMFAVTHALGAPAGLPPRLVNIWVNQGYFETCRRRRFDALYAPQAINTIASTRQYDLSTQTYAVGFVKDLDNKRLLMSTSIRRLNQMDREVEDKPIYYASNKYTIWLQPTPDNVYALEAWAWEEPDPLSSPTQKTILSSYVDPIVEAFAKYYALQALNHLIEARNWFLKAKEMLNELPDDEAARFLANDQQGADVAWDQADLTEVP